MLHKEYTLAIILYVILGQLEVNFGQKKILLIIIFL